MRFGDRCGLGFLNLLRSVMQGCRTLLLKSFQFRVKLRKPNKFGLLLQKRPIAPEKLRSMDQSISPRERLGAHRARQWSGVRDHHSGGLSIPLDSGTLCPISLTCKPGAWV